MNKPTCEELFEEDGYTSVYRKADDSWRHGSYITEVFKRDSDETFWAAHYRKSGDGETNELREGYARICQVEPHQVTTTRYREVA
jgi:hypothetical protein